MNYSYYTLSKILETFFILFLFVQLRQLKFMIDTGKEMKQMKLRKYNLDSMDQDWAMNVFPAFLLLIFCVICAYNNNV